MREAIRKLAKREKTPKLAKAEKAEKPKKKPSEKAKVAEKKDKAGQKESVETSEGSSSPEAPKEEPLEKTILRPGKASAGSVDLEIEIREMVLEDLPQVYALGEKLFTPDRWPTLYRTWDPYEVVELFGADGEFCQVAVLSTEEEITAREKVVGFALGTLLEKRRSAWTYGYLLWLGVDPSYARLGIGERLVETLTALFIEQGARMMLVDTDGDNEAALRFFRRIGFGNENQHVFLSMNLTNHPSYRRKRKRRRKETEKNGEKAGEKNGEKNGKAPHPRA